MRRRKFFQSIVSAALSSFTLGKLATIGDAQAEVEVAPGACILQGATSQSCTEITILTNGAFPIEIEVLDSMGKQIRVSEKSETFSPFRCSLVSKIFVENLVCDEKYVLKVYQNDSSIDQRFFSTVSSKEGIRVAFLSCLNHKKGKLPKHREFWHDLAETKPDLIVLGGDSVYVSSEEKGESAQNSWDFWVRYFVAWNALELFRLPTLIPTVSIWDDHDYGENNGDRSYRFKNIALETFQCFFGTKQIPGVSLKGPGNSAIFAIGGYDLYLMDNRSFRTPNGARGKEQSHWGLEQEEWFLSNLATRRRPSWIVNGSQYFGGYLLDESYEANHPKSFKNILGELKKIRVPIVLISGDRHFTEIMKIEKEKLGFETYEITSSGFHSGNFPIDPWFFFPNKRQIFGNPFQHTYVLADLAHPRSSTEFHFHVAVFSFGNKKLFGDGFSVEV